MPGATTASDLLRDADDIETIVVNTVGYGGGVFLTDDPDDDEVLPEADRLFGHLDKHLADFKEAVLQAVKYAQQNSGSSNSSDADILLTPLSLSVARFLWSWLLEFRDNMKREIEIYHQASSKRHD